MIVPTYWAEARLQERVARKSITVRRFGWSDDSQKDAHRLAEERAREAMKRLKSGEKIERRELKVPYNGAEGLPIREEILSRHGEAVVTRNLYGARCLNTPNVLFADLDFEVYPKIKLTFAIVLVLVAGVIAAIWLRVIPGGFGCFAVAGAIGGGIAGVHLLQRTGVLFQGGHERWAFRRVRQFARKHPDWHLRLYRTPAGFRVLVLHRTFDPGEPAVEEIFTELRTDPIYVKMCRRQKCFRARVSPKPWRVGIQDHLKPRPGVWPIRPERMPGRKRWVARYEEASRGYAACAFVESIGTPNVDPTADAVRKVHDDLSNAETTLPLA